MTGCCLRDLPAGYVFQCNATTCVHCLLCASLLSCLVLYAGAGRAGRALKELLARAHHLLDDHLVMDAPLGVSTQAASAGEAMPQLCSNCSL